MMKQRLLSGWNVQRWLRLSFAIVFLIAGIHGHEPLAFFAAAVFGTQALFDVGCCAGGACAPRRRDAVAADLPDREVAYEEVH